MGTSQHQQLADKIGEASPDALDALREIQTRLNSDNRRTFEGEFEVPPATLAWSNVPVLVKDEPIGRMLILRDITEERMLEQMREDLTHTMVHDLRNPLHMISSGLALLNSVLTQDYDIGEDEERMLAIATVNSDKMLSLVNAILDISQLENRRMPLNQVLLNIDSLIGDVFKAVEPLAQEKNIRLNKQVESGASIVWADRDLVERLFSNLIGNALKFSPEESEICISAVPTESNILVKVSDQGTGIPKEVRGRLFEKFARGQQKGRGSGLGLAFSKMVLEAHDQKIWLEKSSETGTTFAFTLPLPPEA